MMKFITLTCPYCAGQINLFEDHKFGECLHCGRKVMLVNDEVKRDERSDPTYSEFESVRYFIESSDINGGSRLFAEKYRNNPDSAHGWLLCGYLQLMGCKPFDDVNAFKKMIKGNKQVPYETRLQTAFSSWKRGFSVLDNEYYLMDYCKVIGLSLASEDINFRDCSIISHLDDIRESIESHFNISFSADFYYHILKGYLRRKGPKELYGSDEIAFQLMARAILYERDIDALSIKSQLLNNEGLLDEFYIRKDRCVFFILSLIYRRTSINNNEQDKSKMRDSWSEAELYSQNSQKWKSLIANDYTSFSKSDLKILADDIDQYVVFDDSDEESDESEDEDKIDLKKYECIEEEEQTFKQKLSKRRSFTQYIVIDGTLYSRSLEMSYKDFSGSVQIKSDLEKLKLIFEKEYEDIVVGAPDYYEKYSPEEAREYLDEDDEDADDGVDDVEISDSLSDFVGSCIEFVNILCSRME